MSKPMRHYWIPCTVCKKPQYAGLEPGFIVPVAATCKDCDPEGCPSTVYMRSEKHKAAPLAPCCQRALDTEHEGEMPDNG